VDRDDYPSETPKIRISWVCTDGMPISDAEHRFLTTARVARLATADEDGRPHVVPICFAFVEDHLVTPLDDKPKDTDPQSLRRVRDIEANPFVAVIVDRYTEDWTELGWVQVRGMACLIAPSDTDHEPAIDALRAKYSQYADHELDHRPVISIEPGHAVSWGSLTADQENQFNSPNS
jgi:PPOX class probable F420-dependent enzyme